MKLPIIPQDKANHFIYGFVIYILASLFVTPLISLLITAFFATAKEVYDKITKTGQAEIADALFTIAPALILYLLNKQI